MVVLASVILTEMLRYLRHHKWLVNAGCALLGWVAGDMAISDSAIASWANVHLPALVLVSPLLGAAFVLGEPEFMRQGWLAWLARNGWDRENRAVQFGLILVATMTVGMSGYVLYLNSLLGR